MDSMGGRGFGGAQPASAQDIPVEAVQAANEVFDNAREPIGIVLEIAGSGSAIALDLQRL